jgi:hypothetical protein
MGQIKAPRINWLEEAWIISQTVAKFESGPPGLLSTATHWSIEPDLAAVVRDIQDSVSLYLTYRITTVYKFALKSIDGERWLMGFEGCHPDTVLAGYKFMEGAGLKFKGVDRCAFEAHMMLGRILIDTFVCDQWKRELPLMVASIGGPSGSYVASLKAGRPRGKRRPSFLEEEKYRVQRAHPGYSWKELLDELTGDSVVIDWNEETITWKDPDDNVRTTPCSTFRDWKLIDADDESELAG